MFLERAVSFHVGTYATHRADLLATIKTIKASVPGASVRLGSKCAGIDIRGDGVTLRFADGSSAEADVLIGADGVHSVVRSELTVPEQPTYSDMLASQPLRAHSTMSAGSEASAPPPVPSPRMTETVGDGSCMSSARLREAARSRHPSR
jgi:2-polyprenyl-6-methoxyphenol hydroxylase-like FAD-dependent oxidoreductase